jgi:hypothetical protein
MSQALVACAVLSGLHGMDGGLRARRTAEGEGRGVGLAGSLPCAAMERRRLADCMGSPNPFRANGRTKRHANAQSGQVAGGATAHEGCAVARCAPPEVWVRGRRW